MHSSTIFRQVPAEVRALALVEVDTLTAWATVHVITSMQRLAPRALPSYPEGHALHVKPVFGALRSVHLTRREHGLVAHASVSLHKGAHKGAPVDEVFAGLS